MFGGFSAHVWRFRCERYAVRRNVVLGSEHGKHTINAGFGNYIKTEAAVEVMQAMAPDMNLGLNVPRSRQVARN